MTNIFKTYKTLSGEFEYLINRNDLPRQYKSENKALDASLGIQEETKIIKSYSGKLFFIVKDTNKIAYLNELENRFGGVNDFMNYINNR